jgi:hypothetical protein
VSEADYIALIGYAKVIGGLGLLVGLGWIVWQSAVVADEASRDREPPEDIQ